MDPFVGQIVPWSLSWAPRGWAICDGSSLSVASYDTLYDVIGFTYGGEEGGTKFRLPDLRGRCPVGVDAKWPYYRGSYDGTDTMYLGPDNLPSHKHEVTPDLSLEIKATSSPGTTNVPSSSVCMATAKTVGPGPGPYPAPKIYSPIAGATSSLGGVRISAHAASADEGHGGIFDRRQPYLVINYIIALTGLVPGRQSK